MVKKFDGTVLFSETIRSSPDAESVYESTRSSENDNN